MGNTGPGVAPQGGYLDIRGYIDHYLQNYVQQTVLGNGKVLKSVQCMHEEGFVVVKVFIKKDPDFSLVFYQRKLAELRDKFVLHEQPGIITLQRLDETPKAAYLVRQFFAFNLYDRFHSHPFLTEIERKWFVFQLLTACVQMHGIGVRHGDIKTENVMVTSWNWLFLTDIAFYKPTFLPADFPADYSQYFDTGQRRRCYLAPERFYTQIEEKLHSKSDGTGVEGGGGGQDGQVTEAMDIFSLGCVIAEIFLEGEAIFDLPQLLAYRENKYDPTPVINKIQDPDIRALILHMIQRDPNQRLSAHLYLEQWSGPDRSFPHYFSFLYKFFAKLLSPELADTDIKIQAIKHHEMNIIRQVVGSKHFANNNQSHSHHESSSSKKSRDTKNKNIESKQENEEDSKSSNDNDNDTNDENFISYNRNSPLSYLLKHGSKAISELDKFMSTLDQDTKQLRDPSTMDPSVAEASSSSSSAISSPHSLSLSPTLMDPMDLALSDPSRPIGKGVGNGLTMIVNVVCSCIQNVRYPLTKLTALELITRFGTYVDDEVRLGRLVPYTLSLFSDSAGIVRAMAIQTLTNLLSLVESFTQVDAHIFPEYIFPALSRFPNDKEELVRAAFAQCIAKLAETSRKFLDIAQFMNLHQASKKAVSSSNKDKSIDTKGSSNSSNTNQDDASYDKELASLQDTILKLVIDMLQFNQGSKQEQGGSKVKRALLDDITRLCVFMGRKRVNAELLPHLITMLNDRRDWQLRAEFIRQIVGVSVFVGQMTFQNFVLPCIEQALFDVEEFVIQRAVHALISLCELGLFQHHILLATVPKISPLLVHPSAWIRTETIRLFASMANFLGPAKSLSFLIPLLKPYMVFECTVITRDNLVTCLKPPIPRIEWQAELNGEAGVTSLSSPNFSSSSSSSSSSQSEHRMHTVNTPFAHTIPMSPQLAASASSNSPSPVALDGESKSSSPSSSSSSPPSTLSTSQLQSSSIEKNSALRGPTRTVSVFGRTSSTGHNLLLRNNSSNNLNKGVSSSSSPSSPTSPSSPSSPLAMSSSSWKLDEELSQVVLPYINKVAHARQGKSRDEGNDPFDDQAEKYARLEHNVQLYGLEVSKTVPDDAVMMSHLDRVQQDFFDTLGVPIDSLAHHASSNSLERKGQSMSRGTASGGSSRRLSGAAELLQARLRSSQGSVSADGDGGFGTGNSSSNGQVKTPNQKPLIKQSLDKVPDYFLKALSIPPPPPNLGGLRKNTVSTSSFYKNFYRLTSEGPEPVDPVGWKPKGILVTTLHEHRAAVNALSVSRDNLFLASGSDDGTVKIWDCQRLKVTANACSQLTYSQRGRVTDLTVCDSSHSVASASDQGTVHVYKIEYASSGSDIMSRYIGLSDVKKIDQHEEGPVLVVEHFNTLTESLLVYGSQKGVIYGWDLRSRSEAFKLELEPFMGLLTCMTIGPTPYVLTVGTSRGFVVVYDLRFNIPVQMWRHSSKNRVLSITTVDTPSILPRSKTNHFQHPTKGPLIFVSAEGTSEISGFDLYTGESRMVLRTQSSAGASSVSLDRLLSASGKNSSARARNAPSSAGTGSSSSSHSRWTADDKDSKGRDIKRQSIRVSPLSLPMLRTYNTPRSTYATGLKGRLTNEFCQELTTSTYNNVLTADRNSSSFSDNSNSNSNSQNSKNSSVHSFLVSPGDFALTAGSDKCIRYWDLRDTDQSCRVSSPELGPYHLQYAGRLENNTVVFEELLTKSSSFVNYYRQSRNGDRLSSNLASEDHKANLKRAVAKARRGPVVPERCHQDVIMDMAAIEFPQKMLVTAARDGVVKVWV